jgi:hypothetical protein
VAWFTAGEYQRIRAISQDVMKPTFEAFEASMNKRLASLPLGVEVYKIIVHPEELIAFAARRHGGKINSNVRADFAVRRLEEKSPTHD